MAYPFPLSPARYTPGQQDRAVVLDFFARIDADMNTKHEVFGLAEGAFGAALASLKADGLVALDGVSKLSRITPAGRVAHAQGCSTLAEIERLVALDRSAARIDRERAAWNAAPHLRRVEDGADCLLVERVIEGVKMPRRIPLLELTEDELARVTARGCFALPAAA